MTGSEKTRLWSGAVFKSPPVRLQWRREKLSTGTAPPAWARTG